MLISVMSDYLTSNAIKEFGIFPYDYRHYTAKPIEYKAGNKDFCRSISEESSYYKEVLSAFYISRKERLKYGRKWSQCFSQDEALHYCWITIDLKLDRDRPLEIYAYTGQSGNIQTRLGNTSHDNFKVARENKILIHTTKSSDQSHADLVEADEFNELNGKATLQQVEQSNINAIRAVRSIKILNRKDEDTNRIINPILFKKIKQIERMADQLNKRLLKLRQVWLDGSLVPKVSEDQISKAFNSAIVEWYNTNAKRLDLVGSGCEINLPALKDQIELAPVNAKAIETTKHILKSIKGCEIFNNESMGFKYCFKHLFSKQFDNGLCSTFVDKIKELDTDICLERFAIREKRLEAWKAVVTVRDFAGRKRRVYKNSLKAKRIKLEKKMKLKEEYKTTLEKFDKCRLSPAGAGASALELRLMKLKRKIIDCLDIDPIFSTKTRYELIKKYFENNNLKTPVDLLNCYRDNLGRWIEKPKIKGVYCEPF